MKCTICGQFSSAQTCFACESSPVFLAYCTAKCERDAALDQLERMRDAAQQVIRELLRSGGLPDTAWCAKQLDHALSQSRTENRGFDSRSLAEVLVKTGGGFESHEVARGAKGPDGTSVKASAESGAGASFQCEASCRSPAKYAAPASAQEALHLLRNPWGHSEDSIRAARLWAADRLEYLARGSPASAQDEEIREPK
jgi:hypothetical protein